uniref:Uncharacterized protein n=1 Tax=Anopheles quadriannulatus TaxID=34691 RepID=A0A182WZB2_ANOQN
MQCIRSVVGDPSGGAAAAAAGSAVERKILIKTEDSRGLAHGEREEQAERRSREEGNEGCRSGQQEAPDDKKAAGTAPEVRTFVLGENQCIVYGARPGDGSRPTASSPSSSIIVANGGRSSPLSHQGRLSPAGSGCGGAAVQHPHTSSSITTMTTILVSNERASIYKPPTQATSTTTTTVSSSKQQQQQQHGHVTSMQPPPPPPPLKMSKGGGGGGGGGHEEPSSSMPDLGKSRCRT